MKGLESSATFVYRVCCFSCASFFFCEEQFNIFLCLYQLLHFFSCLAIVRVGCFLLGQKIGILCIQCFDLRQLFKPVSSKAALATLCSVISSR